MGTPFQIGGALPIAPALAEPAVEPLCGVLGWGPNVTVKDSSMRKLALISALSLSIGALGATSADAQGYGYGRHHGYGYGHGYHRGYGPRRDYGYRRHRGISTGAAVGLGIAGAAAGAVAAGALSRGPGYYGSGY